MPQDHSGGTLTTECIGCICVLCALYSRTGRDLPVRAGACSRSRLAGGPPGRKQMPGGGLSSTFCRTGLFLLQGMLSLQILRAGARPVSWTGRRTPLMTSAAFLGGPSSSLSYATRPSLRLGFVRPQAHHHSRRGSRRVVGGVCAVSAGTAAFTTSSPSQSAASTSDNSSLHKLQQLRRPRVLFVLGGPGAGKGTQCDLLLKDYNLVHLSAGELLRRERASGSPDGALIEEYISQGRIVPVRISLSLLRREMEECGSTNRFLIDGFPRNFDNVEGWEELMGDVAVVEKVLALDCPQDTLTQRLVKRGETSGRSDDNVDTALKRFHTYTEATRPVIEYYEKQGKVAHIAAQQAVPDVYASIVQHIQPILQQEVIAHTEVLLQAISEGDWGVYEALCDDSMTCFEPEAKGNVITGLGFHKLYFDKGNSLGSHTSTLTQPHVRLLGRSGSACISYVRVVQVYDAATQSHSSHAYEETRVWQIKQGLWKCVHFHRSRPS